MRLNPFPKLYANTAITPRFHGNGFVQIPLTGDGNTRLHVWSPPLPPIPNHNAYIHDHVWDMESRVLLGTIVHRHYQITGTAKGSDPVDVYGVGEADKPGLAAEPNPDFMRMIGEYRMGEGSSYFFPQDEFHSTDVSGWGATIMTKVSTPTLGYRPRVICPRGEQPTDAFAKDHQPDERQMWRAIDEAIRMMSDHAANELLKVLK